MSWIIENKGNKVLKIQESLVTEPYYLNWRHVILSVSGNNLIIRSSIRFELNFTIDYNDVNNLSPVSAEDLLSLISALFNGGGSCTAVQSLTYQIGSGTSNASYAPAYGLYDFSWYAGLWQSSEFTSPADGEIQITGIEVEVSGYTTPYSYENFEVWLSEVTESTLYDPPAVNGTDMTKANEQMCFQGTFTISSNGFVSINFDTNYCFSGAKNLFVEFRNYDGSWQSGFGHGEYDFSPAISRAGYKATDGSYPTGTGTRTNGRINIKFDY